jgi:hypothetical protein
MRTKDSVLCKGGGVPQASIRARERLWGPSGREQDRDEHAEVVKRRFPNKKTWHTLSPSRLAYTAPRCWERPSRYFDIS